MVSETSVKLGRKKQGRQPEGVLRLNEDTGLVDLAGSKKEVDTALKGEEILAFLEEQEEPVRMATIQEALRSKRKPLNNAFRALVERGKVERSGSGKRGDVYHYICCSRESQRSDGFGSMLGTATVQ